MYLKKQGSILLIFANKDIAGVLFCVAPIFATSVAAATYDVNVTYDGVTSTWDGIGDNPIGTASV